MNNISATDIENEENKIPQETNWKHEYERLQVQMEDQKRVFNALMEEHTKHINDLENENQKLKVALKTAQEMSTSDSSNGGNVN